MTLTSSKFEIGEDEQLYQTATGPAFELLGRIKTILIITYSGLRIDGPSVFGGTVVAIEKPDVPQDIHFLYAQSIFTLGTFLNVKCETVLQVPNPECFLNLSSAVTMIEKFPSGKCQTFIRNLIFNLVSSETRPRGLLDIQWVLNVYSYIRTEDKNLDDILKTRSDRSFSTINVFEEGLDAWEKCFSQTDS